MICVRFQVKGRVQGVFYRASARDKAQSLGLQGWVKNRCDGDVELLACGSGAMIDALKDWLWQGPSHARVTEVIRSSVEETCPTSFEIRH